MRVPGYMLRDRVRVKPFSGAGTYGDEYGTLGPELKANVQPSRGIVAGPNGEELVASAKVLLRPEAAETAVAGGIMVWKGVEYRIAASMPLTWRGAVATQLTLTPLGGGAGSGGGGSFG